jgi:ferredoxin, 2Fe-2S
MNEVVITAESPDGEKKILHVPTDMSLNLMEVLKGESFPILATCGGMALCATCHVVVLQGFDKLSPAQDDEWQMLDELPNITETSRLSCQLRITSQLDGLVVRVLGEDNV